jgi:HAD superfamily hydrolase (TIGR01509 family)
VRGVIFDVGGTLIWTNHDKFEEANPWRAKEAAVNVLRSHGFAADGEALWHRLVALRQASLKEGEDFRQTGKTRDTLSELVARSGFTLSERLVDEAERAFIMPEAHGSVPLPGVVEVVRSLSKKVRLAVVSNTRSHLLIEETLRHLGLLSVFDPLVTSAACGWRKPSPRIFKGVLDAWGLPAHELVMIGDSPEKDVEGAKALGMRTLWLRQDAPEAYSHAADAQAYRPEDILEILAGWGVAC